MILVDLASLIRLMLLLSILYNDNFILLLEGLYSTLFKSSMNNSISIF